ncbi:hypothetical protein OIV83_002713 [Microbotryomycetes sp. JL201]|nr:hypothetical protein OIV83_002713 [Microbotryomycetes sp. JL201]
MDGSAYRSGAAAPVRTRASSQTTGDRTTQADTSQPTQQHATVEHPEARLLPIGTAANERESNVQSSDGEQTPRPSIIVLSPRQSPTPQPHPPQRPLSPHAPGGPRLNPLNRPTTPPDSGEDDPADAVETMLRAGLAASARRRQTRPRTRLEPRPARVNDSTSLDRSEAFSTGRTTWTEFLSGIFRAGDGGDEEGDDDQGAHELEALFGQRDVASSSDDDDDDYWNMELSATVTRHSGDRPRLESRPPDSDESALFDELGWTGLAQEEGALDDPLWRVGTGVWMNEPVDVERRDRVPRGGARVPSAITNGSRESDRAVSVGERAMRVLLADPRSPPPNQPRRINVRQAFDSATNSGQRSANNDSTVSDAFLERGPRTRRQATTHALMGRTMRMKRDCLLLYCGGSPTRSLDENGNGGQDDLPPGFHWRAGEGSGPKTDSTTTKGCGKLLCARGYGSDSISPMNGLSVMTPHNWPERTTQKFWASDVPVRAEDVADVGQEQQESPLGVAQRQKGFCRWCRSREIGCRDCGNTIGYRVLKFCGSCQKSNHVELEGMLWRFWQHAVTSRPRLVGVPPASHVDEAVSAVVSSKEIKPNQSDRRERIEPKLPGLIQVPLQIDYEHALAGEPRDWLDGSKDEEDWWLSHSVNIHCQERLSRRDESTGDFGSDNTVLPRSFDGDALGWYGDLTMDMSLSDTLGSYDRLPVSVEASNDYQGLRTPERQNPGLEDSPLGSSGGSNSLRRSGAIRLPPRRMLRRSNRRDEEEQQNAAGRERGEDGSGQDGRRVRTRLDEAGSYSRRDDVDGASSVIRDVEVGYGARHVGRTDRVARMRRLSSMPFMTELDVADTAGQARAGR